MSHRSLLTEICPERGLYVITAVLRDEDGNVLTPATITTLTLTLFDVMTGALIDVANRPAGQDVLNVNDGTLDGAGNFELRLKNDDNQIKDPGLRFEKHAALIRWTYPTNGIGWHEIQFTVENHSYVP